MAVSNRSLVLLALVAAGLQWWHMMDVASTVAHYRRRSVAEQAAVTALRDSAYALGLRIRNAAVRDRIDSGVATYAPQAVPRTIVIGSEAPAAAALAESLFATLPVPADPIHPWRLAVVEFPAVPRWPTGLLGSFAILPSADRGDACTTVTIEFPGDSVLTGYARKSWHDSPFVGAAGPCWFLARFGSPGPEIRAWLDARYWDVAGSIPPNDQPLVYSGTDLGRGRGAGSCIRECGGKVLPGVSHAGGVRGSPAGIVRGVIPRHTLPARPAARGDRGQQPLHQLPPLQE